MKAVFKYTVIFLLTITLMILTLIGIATIPREIIQTKSEESAAYLMRKNVAYYNIVGRVAGRSRLRPGDYSKVDQIADSYLLNIAYYLDAEHPLESVLGARYYDGREDIEAPLNNMNESYQRAVQDQVPTNKQYLRYWHGSLIFVRPMLMFWNIHQIEFFHAVEMGVLIFILIALFLKHGLNTEAMCFCISMIAISVWFVPFCLEFTWMFLLMLIVTVISVKFVLSERITSLPVLYFLTGMLAAYLDFFTTETVTLLVPLLLVTHILFRKEASSYGEIWKLTAKSILLWGIGYIACWVTKWGFAAIVLKENTIPYVRERFWLHLGVTEDMSISQWMTGALIRNLSPLFPFGYGRLGAVMFFFLVIIFFIPIYRNRIVLKQAFNRNCILLYCLLGIIPYVRFLVLSQHAYRHFFFTYRAQAATILALCFVILELVERNPRKGCDEKCLT